MSDNTDRPSQKDSIAALLGALADLGMAGRIRVFGSVMKQKPDAGDVDCVIDFDDPPFAGSMTPSRDTSGLTGLPANYVPVAERLLALRLDPKFQSPKGPLLNCFVRFKGRLLEPNATATWWLASPMAMSIWQKAQNNGAPLSTVTWPPASVSRS